MREPRFDSNLAVLVVGRDTHGNRFKQTATVRNISRRGGMLSEIRCLRAAGEIIQIEHGGRKAAFRVVWIDVVMGRAGVLCMEGEKPFWGKKLPDITAARSDPWRPEPELQSSPPPPVLTSFACSNDSTLASPRCTEPQRTHTGERRFPRYRCQGGAAAVPKGLATKLWGRLTVLGLGGCYVETVSPFREKTQVELLIGAQGTEARLQGEVRCSQPRLGMGVAFTEMSTSERNSLQRLVAAVAGRPN